MAQYCPPEIEFLTPKERKEIASKKVPFYIAEVETGEGKYGANHTFTLNFTDTETGELVQKLISLSDNPRRKRVVDWIRKSLLEDHEPVGPCILETVDTDNGNPAWIFAPAE